MKRITKDMKIKEIFRLYPETLRIFKKYNMECIGCGGAEAETLEKGAKYHGIDINEFLDTLNEFINKKGADEGI